MPDYLSRRFTQVNDVIDQAKAEATRLASQFTTDRPRQDLLLAHAYVRSVSNSIAAASQVPGMVEYAREQWGNQAVDLIAKAQEIEAAADACADFIENNFPSVLSVLNAALTALGTSTAQQNALRAQIGDANLGYALVQRFESGVSVSPIIPATQLGGLVAALNALAAAATI